MTCSSGFLKAGSRRADRSSSSVTSWMTEDRDIVHGRSNALSNEPLQILTRHLTLLGDGKSVSPDDCGNNGERSVVSGQR